MKSFYYTSRRKLLETIKNNINHSNLEKLSFGDKLIWLLNSESKDTLICMCDFLLKRHCFGKLVSHILTLVMSLILVFTIYMIYYAITLCFIMFICPFVGPLIWTNKILSYLILQSDVYIQFLFVSMVNIYWYKTQLYLLDSFNSSIIKTYWIYMYLNILLNSVQTI